LPSRLEKIIGMFRGKETAPAASDGRSGSARALKEARHKLQRQRRSLKRKDKKIARLQARLSNASERSNEFAVADRAFAREEGRGTGSLPEFLILGAQKGGTTFFYDLLCRHPEVEPASVKEVHYFDFHSGESEGWYRSHFPALGPEDGRRMITGEGSPYYLFHPAAPERAARVLPQVRLIALLRNPVDRAYSHYHHSIRRGRESLGFEEALEVEALRLRGEAEKILEDERYDSFNHQWFSYLRRGIYVDQILAWLDFFPEDRMLVIKSEDFFADAAKTMDLACDFLGLTGWEPDIERPRSKKDYGPMSHATRKRLEDYFEPHNRRLYEHLGVDLGW